MMANKSDEVRKTTMARITPIDVIRSISQELRTTFSEPLVWPLGSTFWMYRVLVILIRPFQGLHACELAEIAVEGLFA